VFQIDRGQGPEGLQKRQVAEHPGKMIQEELDLGWRELDYGGRISDEVEEDNEDEARGV
jgi:hypothetical protein